MSDDNLPEDPTQPENETETPESSMLPRRPRGNRRDEEEVVEPDKLDKLREMVSSTKSLILAIGFIIVAAVVAGLINQEDGPAQVDDAWDTVNVAIAKIREVTRTGTFDILDFEADVITAESNPVALGYLQLELGTAALKVAIGDNQPQFSQTKPQILFGDEATITSRVNQLTDSLAKLTDAIDSFNKAKSTGNPLVNLGIYRANYSAAYVKEALMILDAPAALESHRDDAIENLKQAKLVLPQPDTVVATERRSSTDQAITSLRDQIDERLTTIEVLASKMIDAENPLSDGVKDELFYSWLNSYIKDRHATEAAASANDTIPESPILPPNLTDPDRESAFPIDKADETDKPSENSTGDNPDDPEDASGTSEVQEDTDEQ